MFILLFIVYTFTVLENLLIVALIVRNPRLWKPMYIFLGNLSFLEIWYISVTLPNFLATVFSGNPEISYIGCITQLFTFTFLGATECFLLAVMAYDRYLAICKPLHYSLTMQNSYVFCLIVFSWFIGLFTPILPIAFLCQMDFCGSNQIDHYFCDAAPLVRLACGNIRAKTLVDFIVSLIVLTSSLSVIFVSYICIIWNIINMSSSSKGRSKAFSTCTSHLAVVCLFYGSMSFTYIRVAEGSSFSTNKVISVFYSVITPMLNPVIYTLRNEDVRIALHKALSAKKTIGP
ncbi:hypothetical protein GDO86_015691 [Hymenochirus boettgeri]|uniref:Olfactory receptor n=1 Tax=Hymenochirus boettgeri TaxID=247094 RepID=A0A8T2JYD1_9PIPI|nr:hypothetical protein GDO86_015691 [Hymenochirus boettgeri]